MGKVIKDSISNTMITYFGIVIGYLNKGLLFPILLESTQVGLLNIIVLLGIYFSRFSNFGAGIIALKFQPLFKGHKNGAHQIFQFTFSILIVGILVCSLLLICFKPQFIQFYETESPLLIKYFYWIIPIGIVSALYYYLEQYLRSMSSNIVSVFLQDFVLRVIVLIILIGYSFKLFDFEVFLILFLLSHFIPGVFLLVYAIKNDFFHFTRKKLVIKRKLKKIMLTYGMYIYLNSFGQVVVLMADAVMLAAFSGLKEVGVFTVMMFISNVLNVPYLSLLRITTPLLPVYWKDKNLKKINEIHKDLSSIGFFSIFFLFSLFWLNYDALLTFLPPEYANGKYVLLFLTISRMLDSIGSLNGDILLVSNYYKIDLFITIPLIFMTFYFNYLLIPIYNGTGAAIATSLVFLTYNIVRLSINYYLFKIHPFTKELMIVIILAICSLLFAEFLVPKTSIFVLDFVICTFLPIVLFFLPVYWLNLIPQMNVLIGQFIKRARK